LWATEVAKARHRTIRMRRKSILSQARIRRKLWPTAERMTLAASPARPLEITPTEVAFRLQVSDHGLDGGAAPQLALDDPEDAALVVGDEDAARVVGVMAAISLVDIGTLDRTAGECLGAFDDVAQGVTVERVIGQRPGVQHEQAAGSAAVVVVRCVGLALRPRCA
jgi:hypothetical protein